LAFIYYFKIIFSRFPGTRESALSPSKAIFLNNLGIDIPNAPMDFAGLAELSVLAFASSKVV
ncbi:MAG: hypothetical protein PVG90_06580, partial [Bacillota bacterium]